MIKKSVLMLGCNSFTESFPKYFREQCNYSEFRLDSRLIINLETVVNTPDIIFLQIQSDTIDGQNTVSFLGEQMSRFRKRGSYIINWTGDFRDGTPSWMMSFANHVDITMFSNMRDVDNFKGLGLNTGFLQCGIDTNIFKPEGEKADTAEIVFLANNYGNQFPLSRYRKDVVNALQLKYGSRFKVYGNGWPNSGNVNSSQYEEAKVYRGCKIAISVSHFDSDRYFSDRLGRAMCSGAMVLSHNYKGIEKDFDTDKHLDTFHDIEDMLEACNYWLADDEQRNEFAAAGQQLASKEFSYQRIVSEIIKIGS